jgi:hypothetical protein
MPQGHGLRDEITMILAGYVRVAAARCSFDWQSYFPVTHIKYECKGFLSSGTDTSKKTKLIQTRNGPAPVKSPSGLRPLSDFTGAYIHWHVAQYSSSISRYMAQLLPGVSGSIFFWRMAHFFLDVRTPVSTTSILKGRCNHSGPRRTQRTITWSHKWITLLGYNLFG